MLACIAISEYYRSEISKLKNKHSKKQKKKKTNKEKANNYRQVNKGGKFLKKLWCFVGGGNEVIWLYQLSENVNWPP